MAGHDLTIRSSRARFAASALARYDSTIAKAAHRPGLAQALGGMNRTASISKEWLLLVALVIGLLGSVALAKHVPATMIAGLGSTAAAAALAVLIIRQMRASVGTRASLLLLFTIAFILSVRWVSTFFVP